jgi:hypothetical protein
MSPRHTTIALRLHRETIEGIAAHVVGDDHRRRLASGYVLCRSSRIFRAPNGSFTGRFAYRHHGDRRSIVETVPGLSVIAEVPAAELKAGWLRLEVVAIEDGPG